MGGVRESRTNKRTIHILPQIYISPFLHLPDPTINFSNPTSPPLLSSSSAPPLFFLPSFVPSSPPHPSLSPTSLSTNACPVSSLFTTHGSLLQNKKTYQFFCQSMILLIQCCYYYCCCCCIGIPFHIIPIRHHRHVVVVVVVVVVVAIPYYHLHIIICCCCVCCCC